MLTKKQKIGLTTFSILAVIAVGVSLFFLLVWKKCPNDCSGQGKCNKIGGKCECNKDYGGEDCSIKMTCDQDCGKNGKCNKGKCECDEDYYGDDCSKKYIDCEYDCGAPEGGECDRTTGLCKCNKNYELPGCISQKEINDFTG